ncbi:TPA: PerC family transcriptional regulator [Escherichia coli]|uniref:PerC family transcriptional regulator n=1 Tax=Escherichia coli TaxID=562 RepID=UPI000D07EC23|nr:PerC family transcriptional regulator [Escherichia coli]EEY5671719.1 PerC family transcriptional regulator [Escherichia coli]EFC4567464.1 PerC family transcriptional regulator [Escherichia coli]EFC7693753.1 PerC family transcriptional regulator [Escherichia coli]EFH7663826.1 PerC family transcriptional regulator [Escherichia coli]
MFLSRKKKTPEVVEDTVALKLEAASHWRRASARWLSVIGSFEYSIQTTNYALNVRFRSIGPQTPCTTKATWISGNITQIQRVSPIMFLL